MLEREEYIEQAYFYRTLCERLPKNMPLQELLRQVREELLVSTKLPLAIDFLRTELEHVGVFATAMSRLPHYFTSFQTYLVREAESERGRFDMRTALEVLRSEAEYRSGDQASRQGLFLFQFETLCRNRLRYDLGLTAISDDPLYDDTWRNWILRLRAQIGLIDFAHLLYVSSQYYANRRRQATGKEMPSDVALLFGEKEGKIAAANRNKDPLFLFAALQRHLNYPAVPRPRPSQDRQDWIAQMARRLERLEMRVKLMEQEQREGAVDLTKWYPPDAPSTP